MLLENFLWLSDSYLSFAALEEIFNHFHFIVFSVIYFMVQGVQKKIDFLKNFQNLATSSSPGTGLLFVASQKQWLYSQTIIFKANLT